MNYTDGLNYLDQLRDYVQNSISVRQKFNKAEQSENFQPIEDSLSFKEKGEGLKNDENNDEFDLFDLVKAEISDQGKFLIEILYTLSQRYEKGCFSVGVLFHISKEVFPHMPLKNFLICHLL